MCIGGRGCQFGTTQTFPRETPSPPFFRETPSPTLLPFGDASQPVFRGEGSAVDSPPSHPLDSPSPRQMGKGSGDRVSMGFHCACATLSRMSTDKNLQASFDARSAAWSQWGTLDADVIS